MVYGFLGFRVSGIKAFRGLRLGSRSRTIHFFIEQSTGLLVGRVREFLEMMPLQFGR